MPADDENGRKKLFTLVKDIKTASLVTQDVQGRLYARPMMTLQSPQEESTANTPDALWFLSRFSAPKITDIQNHPKVLLIYSDPESSSYVTLAGHATITRDQGLINDIWDETAHRTWFPDGPGSLDLALIKVICEAGEYWDVAANVMTLAFGYLKARLTGETADLADNQKINFRAA